MPADENAITDMEKEDAEIGVKKRVKNIISYKKPAFRLIATGVVCCCTLSGCFLTNPSEKAADTADPDVMTAQAGADEDSEITIDAEEVNVNGSESAEEPEQPETVQTAADLGTPAFQGDINGNGTDDFIFYTYENDDEFGPVRWFLLIDDKVVYEDTMDIIGEFTVWNLDIDNEGSEELIIAMNPHVNGSPLTTYEVLKQNGSSWTALQNSDEFSMTDYNGDPNNSFPIRVILGKDLKTGEISIDGNDQKITFDLEDNYRKLAVDEEGNDIGDFAQKFLDGKVEAGYEIGRTADWGIWDLKPAKLDGRNCLIARQGLSGKDTGKFDMYGTLDIYFDYDATGNINILKTVFNENNTDSSIEDDNIIED